MDMPEEVRRRFRRYGQAGGRVRAARMTPGARRTVARVAAIRRWTRARFGESRFAALGLPSGAMIDAGIADLAAERDTPESLAVALAAPRLEREGVPLPPHAVPDPDHRLYRRLAGTEGDLAHARYNALLSQVVSFADACAALRVDRAAHAT